MWEYVAINYKVLTCIKVLEIKNKCLLCKWLFEILNEGGFGMN
jgi:hypothetical protein